MVRGLTNRRRFESLEDRLLLAADAVTAISGGGNLSILGDGKADAFLVSGDGTSDGKVTITGYTGSDGNPTHINGAASATFTGVTGAVTMLLGNGNVTVSVADLDLANSLTILGGNGNETIDIGKLARLTNPSGLTSQAVVIGDDLTIAGGNGKDSVNIGETCAIGRDVSVGGTVIVTFGNGGDSVAEESLAMGGDGFITLGSGNNTVTVGPPVIPAVSAAVKGAAISQLLNDDDVSVGNDFWVQTGSNTAAVSAALIQYFDEDIITPIFGWGWGNNPTPTSSAVQRGVATVQAFVNANPSLKASVGSSSVNCITINDLISPGLAIPPAGGAVDVINIQNSYLADVGFGLGTSGGSLTIGNTTVTDLAVLVALSTSDTYTDLGGNSYGVPTIVGFDK